MGLWPTCTTEGEYLTGTMTDSDTVMERSIFEAVAQAGSSTDSYTDRYNFFRKPEKTRECNELSAAAFVKLKSKREPKAKLEYTKKSRHC
jgi:hypothetical protein